MEVKQLPKFTAERYFLLSEVEQRVQFHYILSEGIDNDGSAKKMPHKAVIKHDAFYILWDLRSNSNHSQPAFESDVTTLLTDNNQHKDFDRLASSFLAIEVIVDSKKRDDNNDSTKNRIQKLVNWIKDTYKVGCVYVGISDSPAGAPALEALMEFASLVDDHYSKVTSKRGPFVRLNGLHQVHFLGFDPAREPTAEDGVYQAECIFAATSEKTGDTIHSSVRAWLRSQGIGAGIAGKGKKKHQGFGNENDGWDLESTGFGWSAIIVAVLSIIVMAFVSHITL